MQVEFRGTILTLSSKGVEMTSYINDKEHGKGVLARNFGMNLVLNEFKLSVVCVIYCQSKTKK